jgi:hypothetical protein
MSAAVARVSDDDTDRRIRAYLASVRPLQGGSYEDDNYHRGRSLVERLALSSSGDDEPILELSPIDCANILHFVHSSEPFEPRTWWKDPEHGPSHLVGFAFVLRAVEDSLRAVGSRRRVRS